MDFSRKQLWDKFYALVIADILIQKHIISPTLKKQFQHISGIDVYYSLIEDLKIFFESAELEYLIQFTNTVIEESNVKEVHV